MVVRPGGGTGLALCWRTLWETMSSHWPTADQQPGVTPAQIEFAHRWRDMPKVVFSSTTSTVDRNTRLVTGDAVTPRSAATECCGSVLVDRVSRGAR